MKKLYALLLFVIVTFSASAQIVNIPDPVFKQTLLDGTHTYANNAPVFIDVNDDGEVQETEALLVDMITIEYDVADAAGIQSFTNVKKLYLSANMYITSLDISNLQTLEEFDARYSQLATLNFFGANLTSLWLSDAQLTTLDLTSLATNTQLTELDLSGNELTSIDLSPLATTPISRIYLYNNKLQSFDFSGVGPNIDELDLGYNEITEIDFSPVNHDFDYLDVSNNLYTHLDTYGLDYVMNLTVGSETLNSIKFTTLNFFQVYINGSNINVVDFKNGVNDSCFSLFTTCSVGVPQLSFATTPQHIVCVDDFPYIDPSNGQDKSEANYFNLTLNGEGGWNAPDSQQITTYCSFTPGGTFNTVVGNVKLDCGSLNQNIPGISISGTEGMQFGYNQTNTNGEYIYYATSNNITIAPQLEFPSYFNITPPDYAISFAAPGSTETANFCLTPNGVHHNLEVNLIPVFLGNPGFNAAYDLVYTNNGNQPASGTVSFNFDESVLDLVSTSQLIDAQSANTFSWNYSNLLPFESRAIRVTLNLNSPMETPALNMGDVLNYTANVASANIDETPADNTFTLNQTVVNSMDPNDKTVTEGPQVNIDNVGDYLHYRVRFQNEGTAAAQNVVVKDYLDADLDWATVEPVSASHDYRMTLTNGNRLEFIFEGINLPASSVDEPGSNGYIAFKVKPKNTATVGTEITNTAGIYFDFNFPIYINMTTTTFNLLGTQHFAFEPAIRLHPNPAGNILNVSSDNGGNLKTVSIYNLLGQLVRDIPNAVASEKMTMDVSGLKTGMYLVTIGAEKGQSTQRFIKD